MKKNWKRIAGMMAFMLGIGLTPIQADADANMTDPWQKIIETAPEIDVLKMPKEQPQYVFFSIDWEREMET